MKQSVFHERMETPTTQGKVAHKIGSYDEFIHDMGDFRNTSPLCFSNFFTKGPDNAKSARVYCFSDR